VRTIFTFAALLLLGADQLRATAILAFRPNDSRIILAADSAVTGIEPDGTMRYRGGECKLAQAGKWWLVSGALESAKGLSSVTRTVTQAATPESSMIGALSAIHRAYESTILPVLLRLDPYFTTEFKVDRPLVEVLVAGVDGGVLTLGYYGALLKSQKPRELVAGGLICPGAFCDSPGRVLHGASVGGVIPDLLAKQPRPAWLDRADASAARRLIQMQIDKTPQYVAGPIDVLEITAGGARWIDRDARSACSVLTGG